MPLRQAISSVLFCTLLLVGCAQSEASKSLTVDELFVLRSEVEEAVWAFHAADTSRNAEGVINLMWPQFSMLVDGNRIGYEQAVHVSRAFMPTLKTFHTEWTDLRIDVLSETHAVSSFIFSDSIVTLSGELTRSMGPNTFIWEQRGGIWKVLIADADHYPIDGN